MASILDVRRIAPSSELGVEVAEVGEGAPLVEVILDVVEGALDAAGAVRVSDGMGLEVEAEASGERPEDRGRNRVLRATLRDDHGAVVDHAPPRAPAEVHDRLGQKGAALEARPPRIDLRVQQPAVAEDEARALQFAFLVAHADRMRRRVVLHLLSGREVISTCGDLAPDADAFASAEVGQGRIADRDRGAMLEFLGDTNEVPTAVLIQLADKIEVVVELRGSMKPRDICLAALEDGPNRVPRQTEGTRDGSLADPLLVQMQDGLPRLPIMHDRARYVR